MNRAASLRPAVHTLQYRTARREKGKKKGEKRKKEKKERLARQALPSRR